MRRALAIYTGLSLLLGVGTGSILHFVEGVSIEDSLFAAVALTVLMFLYYLAAERLTRTSWDR